MFSPDDLRVLAPERVDGAQKFGLLEAPVDGACGRFLVRNGDVTAATRAAQRGHQMRKIGVGAAEGHVHGVQPQGAEGGVVHDRRERMRDGIAEDGEDARAADDHRTVPATRLTTLPISSCNSANVAR